MKNLLDVCEQIGQTLPKSEVMAVYAETKKVMYAAAYDMLKNSNGFPVNPKL